MYPDQLERLLRLLLTMVEHYKETDVLEKNSVYLMIIGHHLSALAAFITPHCLHLLAQIESRLSVQNKIIFVRYVLWGSHLAKIKDPVLL